MENTFGFIGAGNMGGALARAAAKAVSAGHIVVSDLCEEKATQLAADLGCKTTSAEQIASDCAYIFLGVKPQVLGALLQSLQPALSARTDRFVLVSMAAGIAIADVQRMAGNAYPVIRIMPNTPVSVGGGVILYDASENVPAEMLSQFRDSMQYAGMTDALAEKLIDAGSALSGCGPAFACLFLEALADGAVACGLPRDKALTYGAHMLMGTAKLVLESGKHPADLKDAVCSPGGSTIAGVRAMEQANFRGSVIAAVDAAFARTKELGK